MLEFLQNLVWYNISIAISKDIEETKIIILNLEKRLKNDKHFNPLELDKRLRKSFEFYLKSKSILKTKT